MLSPTSNFPWDRQKAILLPGRRLLLWLRPPAVPQPAWAAEAARGCCELPKTRRGWEPATCLPFSLLPPPPAAFGKRSSGPKSAVRSNLWGAKRQRWYCRFLLRLWQRSEARALPLLQAPKAYGVGSSSREPGMTQSALKKNGWH